MATEKLVLITSGPTGGAAAALDLATGMRWQGEAVDVCLLQDAVLCALKGNETAAGAALSGALQAGVDLHYLEDDLRARGFRREDVRTAARAVSYDELAGMLLEQGRRPLGAF